MWPKRYSSSSFSFGPSRAMMGSLPSRIASWIATQPSVPAHSFALAAVKMRRSPFRWCEVTRASAGARAAVPAQPAPARPSLVASAHERPQRLLVELRAVGDDHKLLLTYTEIIIESISGLLAMSLKAGALSSLPMPALASSGTRVCTISDCWPADSGSSTSCTAGMHR